YKTLFRSPSASDRPARVNLLNWGGNQGEAGLFPPTKGQPGYGDGPTGSHA
ncbi:hypothetical protein HGA02_13450, partial [Cellulomonas septica]|nr:hypothetical protein [Cellulomonas septica]